MNDFLLNEEPALRAVTFLKALKLRAIETGSSLLSNLNPNDIKLIPSELFVHAEISGGGTQHLLTGETTKVPGITNFDGNKLNKGRFFVANGITVAYGEEDADTKLYNVAYDKELPPVLLASEIAVKQSGNPIIQLPIRSIIFAKKTKDYYRALEALALVVEESETSIEIYLPSGSTIAPSGGKKPFIGVYIKGFETHKKF